MKKTSVKPQYIRLDKKSNALDYLDRAYQFIQQVDQDVLAWKWVIIALHGALYGFAICACAGSNPDRVAPIIKKGKNKGKRHLIGLDSALESCQNFKSYVYSKPLQLSDKQKESIRWLKDGFRNEFEHFTPKGWCIELYGMAHIIIDVLDVIHYLVLETGNFRLTQSQKRKVRSILFQSKRILKQGKLYRETENLNRIPAP